MPAQKYSYPPRFLRKDGRLKKTTLPEARKWLEAQKKSKVKSCKYEKGETRESCNTKGYRARCGRCCGPALKKK